ncbi:MAG: sigma-70 family RNA polymerase sigma factor [Undibacterium sp.]|nr:sigma-70 family RNA polymerase sigma factor [Opitutaceae bacterium]
MLFQTSATDTTYPPTVQLAEERAVENAVSPGPLAEDIDLMIRVARREIAAFEQLYDRFSHPMFSLVLRIVRSPSEAEDVLQDVFFQIWTRAPDYQPQLGSPFAWVATIMRRKAIDRLRAQIRRGLHLVAPSVPCMDPPNPSDTRAPLLATERRQEVCAALATLAAGEHRAIELAFFDGLSHQEISEALRLPIGTVKARIRRGLFKLRTKLAPLHAA